MELFRLDIEQYQAEGTIFPSRFQSPEDFGYHGTSSALCGLIQRDGLRPAASGITRSDCQAVVSIFDEINWAGSTIGGAPSLRSFSLAHDLSQSRGDPLFLANQPHTAAYFASRDWAGGEKASAIRKAIADLQRLVDDPEFRTRQAADATFVLDEKRPVMIVADDSIEALRFQLKSLATLREKCQQPYDSFRHGVIYAVQLSQDFVRDHCEKTGLSLRVFAPIPASTLAAKVYLPPGFRPRS